MAKIFVSYARKDTELVKTIVAELNNLGFDYWMDTRNLQSGDIWPEEITDAILDCSRFLLFMSSASMASDSVEREAQIAYENKKKIIILRLEKVEISKSLKYQLARIQWTEYSASDWKTRLAIAIRSRSKPSSVNKPKPASVSLQVTTKTDETGEVREILNDLQNVFFTNETYYKDQCDTILDQVTELRKAVETYSSSLPPLYTSQIPARHIITQIDVLQDLIGKFRNTCPPGSIDIHRSIIRTLEAIKNDLLI